MDSISYVYISWTIHGMWMIYITFERGGPKFSNTTLERSPSAQPCSSVSWEQNGYSAAQDFFALVSTLKLSRRLLCSVRFVFVSTFSGGIWKFRTASFKCYVDNPHTRKYWHTKLSPSFLNTLYYGDLNTHTHTHTPVQRHDAIITFTIPHQSHRMQG